MIPHVQDLHDEYKSQGLVVMAPHVQSADREALEVLVLKHGITYAVAVKSDTSDYPGRGIPRGALINVDGQIVWQGHPGSSEFEKLLKKELKRVDLYGGRLIYKTDKAIAKKLLTNKLGSAWKALEKKGATKAKAEGVTSASSNLDIVVARLTAKAEGMLAQAKRMVEAGDYLGGELKCTEVERLFKGSAWAAKAKAFKKEIKAKDDYKTVKKAGGLWMKIKVLSNGKGKQAIQYAKILQAKFGDTWYGKQADKVARLLRSSR